MAEFLSQYGKYAAVLLGMLAGFSLVYRRWKRPVLSAGLCLFFSAVSVVAAMLFAAFEAVISGKELSPGAISTYGVYFICPVILLLIAKLMKLNGKAVMDTFAQYAMPSLFFLRCNCLFAGCCGGRLIPGTELHWPTRQAELLFYAAFLCFLLYREKRGAIEGTGFPLLMAVYGAFRFVEEWFREGTGTSLVHLAHLWSLLALIIGLGVYFELNSIKAKAGSGHEKRSASK